MQYYSFIFIYGNTFLKYFPFYSMDAKVRIFTAIFIGNLK